MNKLPRNIDLKTLSSLNYLEADGNYTYLHQPGGGKTLTCYTLKRYADLLPGFVRVHKRFLINPARISSVYENHRLGGHFVEVAFSSPPIPIARRRVKPFFQQFNASKAAQ